VFKISANCLQSFCNMCHFQRREFRLTNILLNVWPSSKAHAKNFHGGFFIQWHVVVICIWFELFVTSQFDVIFMFSNQHFGEGCCHNMHIILHALYFTCHCTEYKVSALQVRTSEENTLNAATQQFITAKISGSALEQRSKTHSSLRQCNLQLQNQSPLMSSRIEQSSVEGVLLDWLAHTPVCKIESF